MDVQWVRHPFIVPIIYIAKLFGIAPSFRGSNEIDANSLQRAMIHLGQTTLRYADCEAMIREVDRQGRGSISRDDFHRLQISALDTT